MGKVRHTTRHVLCLDIKTTRIYVCLSITGPVNVNSHPYKSINNARLQIILSVINNEPSFSIKLIKHIKKRVFHCERRSGDLRNVVLWIPEMFLFLRKKLLAANKSCMFASETEAGFLINARSFQIYINVVKLLASFVSNIQAFGNFWRKIYLTIQSVTFLWIWHHLSSKIHLSVKQS